MIDINTITPSELNDLIGLVLRYKFKYVIENNLMVHTPYITLHNYKIPLRSIVNELYITERDLSWMRALPQFNSEIKND